MSPCSAPWGRVRGRGEAMSSGPEAALPPRPLPGDHWEGALWSSLSLWKLFKDFEKEAGVTGCLT